VNSGAHRAVQRFERLADVLDQARGHARGDATALASLLGQAEAELRLTSADVAALRGLPPQPVVLQAALHAKQSHDALTSEIQSGLAAIAEELRRLTAGREATGRYSPESVTVSPLRLDQVG
jgi:hypothetical protein